MKNWNQRGSSMPCDKRRSRRNWAQLPTFSPNHKAASWLPQQKRAPVPTSSHHLATSSEQRAAKNPQRPSIWNWHHRSRRNILWAQTPCHIHLMWPISRFLIIGKSLSLGALEAPAWWTVWPTPTLELPGWYHRRTQPLRQKFSMPSRRRLKLKTSSPSRRRLIGSNQRTRGWLSSEEQVILSVVPTKSK